MLSCALTEHFQSILTGTVSEYAEFSIQTWDIGIGIRTQFSMSLSEQPLQAPESFGWQFQSYILAFCKHTTKPQPHHCREQVTVSAAAEDQLERDGRTLFTACGDAVPKWVAMNISTRSFWAVYFCTLSGSVFPQNAMGEKKHFGRENRES